MPDNDNLIPFPGPRPVAPEMPFAVLALTVWSDGTIHLKLPEDNLTTRQWLWLWRQTATGLETLANMQHGQEEP